MSHLSHPIWRKFAGRRLTILRLSDEEHRLRDAHALLRLERFLQPFHPRYETITLDGARQPIIDADDGIVILGRPSLYPRSVQDLIRDLVPRLMYEFSSDDPSDHDDYRTIRRIGSQSTDLPRGVSWSRSPDAMGDLTDYAFIHSGWRGRQPVIVLAGSSTVGTWGAADCVTRNPGDAGAVTIWEEDDVQAVVAATVPRTRVGDAFLDVSLSVVELLAPCRFWLAGGSRPPADGWTRDTLQLDVPQGPDGFDLRILVNDKPIPLNARNYVTSLALMAWLSLGRAEAPWRELPLFTARVTAADVTRAIGRFLQVGPSAPLILAGESEPVSTPNAFAQSGIGRNMNKTLDRLTDAIRDAGGMAFVERQGKDQRFFTLVSRHTPHFFPDVR